MSDKTLLEMAKTINAADKEVFDLSLAFINNEISNAQFKGALHVGSLFNSQAFAMSSIRKYLKSRNIKLVISE